jgi:hypothetical protein
MMLRDVLPGSRRAEGEGRVSKVLCWTFIDGEVGFRGVGVRFWARYQAKILWPNFWGFEEAPATAMRGEDMKVRAAVCMVCFVVVVSLEVVLLEVLLLLSVVVVVVVGFERWICDLVVAGISGWWV